MTRIIIEMGLALILIVLFSWSWMGRVSSILIATGVISLYGIWFLTKNGFLSGSIKKKIIYAELKYSAPIIMMQLSMFCLFSSDSFLLSGITKNNSEVGIYGMACVFGSVLITLSSALIQYMVPKINKTLSAPYIDYSEIRGCFIVYFGLMAFAYTALLLLVPVIYHLYINSDYWPGIDYYFFLSTGYFFWTITIFLYSFLLYFKQKKLLLILATSSIIISLGSNYFFIHFQGAFGASVSVCISYFALMLITLIVTKKYWLPLLHSAYK